MSDPLQMGEEVHYLCGVWQARRLAQKQCSHLQLDLLPSRGMAGKDLHGNTNRIDKTEPAADGEIILFFPPLFAFSSPSFTYLSL
jgi:hypothetical protein